MATVSVDRVELYYKEAGEGPPLLLIHGSGPDADGWGDAFDELARDFRVIAYDRRGFSRTGGEPLADWRRHGDDAARLLQELDAAPAAVAGWSAGGTVALDLAVHHPELVRSLVLIEPGFRGRKKLTPGLVRATLGAQLRRRRKGDREGAERMFRWITGYGDAGTAWDKVPDDRKERLLGNAAALFKEFESRDTYLTDERVAGIDCPVSVVVGARTQSWFRRTSANAAELIPQAELVTVEGTGHAFSTDAPQELARVIREGSVVQAGASA